MGLAEVKGKRPQSLVGKLKEGGLTQGLFESAKCCGTFLTAGRTYCTSGSLMLMLVLDLELGLSRA